MASSFYAVEDGHRFMQAGTTTGASAEKLIPHYMAGSNLLNIRNYT